MAALNFTPISLYYSTTAAAVPSAGNLVSGELAINITDEKLYFKNAAGTVKLLASNATSAPVTSFSAGTTGLTPNTATTGAITLAGTLAIANGGTGTTSTTFANLTTNVTGVLPTANGGTNLSSFTSGGVVYASSSSALATGSALTFNGSVAEITTANTGGVNGFTATNTVANGYSAFTVKNTGASGKTYEAGVGGNGTAGYYQNNYYIRDTTGNPTFYVNSTGAGVVGTLALQTTTLPSAGTASVFARTTDSSLYMQAATGGGINLLDGSQNSMALFSASTIQLLTGNTTRFQIGSAGQLGIGGATYGSAGQVLTSGGASAAPTWSTPSAGVTTAGNNTFTGVQTFNGTSSNIAAVFVHIAETTYISAGANSGNVSYFGNGSVQYFTANNSANWTQNILFDSVTLDTAMSVGQTMTMSILSTNGGTAYYPTSVQINGTTSGVTTKWQGGTAPTSGNANSIDVYTYTIIKTASATFTVLASQTKFA
jgi:hypothetical protein